MIGRVSPITGTWNSSAGRKDGARSLPCYCLKKVQGEVSLSCPGLTMVQDMPQLQEAIAELGRPRCGHIWILLHMESYLVCTVINDNYKGVCRYLCLGFHREEGEMEEEVG